MLSLPVEVICDSIFPFLSFPDFRRLDSAYTNKVLRSLLQSVWYRCHENAPTTIASGHIDILSIGRSIVGIKILHNIPPTMYSHAYCTIVHFVSSLFSSKMPEFLIFHSRCHLTLKEELLAQIARNCPNLQVLHFKRENIIKIGAATLAQHCRQLRTISFSEHSITDAGIQAFCDNCPHLRNIDISNCSNLTDASLVAIANTYPNLQYIDIKKCLFTDDALIFFANRCHELRAVAVSAIDKITRRGINALWTANANLTDIDIMGNNFMSDDDIMLILQCCPQLLKLNKASSRVTDAGVIALAEHCPQLRSLNISMCDGTSNASLIALGQHCHELKSINISYLKNISDEGVIALAAGCAVLEEVTALQINVTDASVIFVTEHCPHLYLLDFHLCYNLSPLFIRTKAYVNRKVKLSSLREFDFGIVR